MPPLRRSNKPKQAPFFTTEWLIQNHGDISAVLCTLLLGGLVINAIYPLSKVFVIPQHKKELPALEGTDAAAGANNTISMYTYGFLDVPSIFFQFLLMIMLHALVQENALEKLSRRLHLSKIKISKFYESCQLFWFYLAAAATGIFLIFTDPAFEKLSSLWDNYPHSLLSLFMKIYFTAQIAYWLHWFPEFFLQKMKKEEISERLLPIVLHLAYVVGAYVLNFTRVAVVLLVLHYLSEGLYHAIRILYFTGLTRVSKWGFRFFNLVFVLTRLASICIGVLVFWYGLEKSNAPAVNFIDGNFNTTIIRINALFFVLAAQMYLFYQFTMAHVKRLRARMEERMKRQQAMEQRKRTEQQKSATSAIKKEKDREAAASLGASEKESADEAAPAKGADDQLPDVVPSLRKRAAVAVKGKKA